MDAERRGIRPGEQPVPHVEDLLSEAGVMADQAAIKLEALRDVARHPRWANAKTATPQRTRSRTNMTTYCSGEREGSGVECRRRRRRVGCPEAVAPGLVGPERRNKLRLRSPQQTRCRRLTRRKGKESSILRKADAASSPDKLCPSPHPAPAEPDESGRERELSVAKGLVGREEPVEVDGAEQQPGAGGERFDASELLNVEGHCSDLRSDRTGTVRLRS